MGACLAGGHKGEPARVGAGMGGGDDFNLIAVLQFGAQSHQLVVDLGGNAAVTDVRMHGIGKIDAGRALRQIQNLALGREHVNLIGEEVDLDVLARGTPGFSGADLENLVNEAALHAAKVGKDRVNMSDFEEAKDKVLMGKERRSIILSDEEKKTTAYHEAGHALVAKLIPGTDPVHKVTIIPRGMALGLTQYLPVDDRHSRSRKDFEGELAMLFGGRVAEELVLGQLTTGASNDIMRATKIARNMVCKWGMSEKFGPMSYGDDGQQVFLGRDFMQHKDYSEETARLIDAEIRRFVDEGYQRAKKLLSENMENLHRIAGALLERETVSGDEIDMLMRGETLPPPVEEGSVRRAARVYEDMSRKFGDTPPADQNSGQPGDGQADAPASAPSASAPSAAGAPEASAQTDAPAPKAPEDEFKLEEVPPKQPRKPYKPDQED